MLRASLGHESPALSARNGELSANPTLRHGRTHMMSVVRVLISLILFPCLELAQVEQFEGKRIVNVQFSQPTLLDPADLKNVVSLKAGEPLLGDDVARTIDALFATGLFQDIA